MIHVFATSGGKDSTAVLCWAKENGHHFCEPREAEQMDDAQKPSVAVFMDTGWEHPLTYGYLEYLDAIMLGGALVRLRSEKYDGFRDLAIKRKMVPRQHARFCTEELKIIPMHRFLETLDGDVTVYQGIRAEESSRRSAMPRRQWMDEAGGYWVERPIFGWTSDQVFDIMRRHGVNPNPLYLMGATRVGCWPCIYVNKSELRAYLKNTPGLKERVIELERDLNAAVRADNPDADWRSFFHSDFVPEECRSQRYTNKKGETVGVPTAEDVFRYIEQQDGQGSFFPDEPPGRCMSVYNLCSD